MFDITNVTIDDNYLTYDGTYHHTAWYPELYSNILSYSKHHI
jgi:hypothetical protein